MHSTNTASWRQTKCFPSQGADEAVPWAGGVRGSDGLVPMDRCRDVWGQGLGQAEPQCCTAGGLLCWKAALGAGVAAGRAQLPVRSFYSPCNQMASTSWCEGETVPLQWLEHK